MHFSRSEVLPAVLDAEVCVDVFEWHLVLVGCIVHENFGPLDGVLNIWEFDSPILLRLKSLSLAIVIPCSVRAREGWMSMAFDVVIPVAQSKSTELYAKLPIVLGIFDRLVMLFIGELLVLVLFNPLIKVAWNSWEVVESWLVNSIFILAGDDERRAFLLSGFRVEIHASTCLHGSGHWLLNLLSHVWLMAAFNNFDIEFDIRMLRNGLTTDWSPGEGTTVHVV